MRAGPARRRAFICVSEVLTRIHSGRHSGCKQPARYSYKLASAVLACRLTHHKYYDLFVGRPAVCPPVACTGAQGGAGRGAVVYMA